MEDTLIIDLYVNRNEAAIEKTAAKYGNYCFTIANNILADHADTQECVNDTYLKTWEQIPPTIPRFLRAFLGKITRNLALDRYRFKTRDKRGGSEFELLLDELEDCVATRTTADSVLDLNYTKTVINDWLKELPTENRMMFIRRYWYVWSIQEVAKSLQITESKAKSTLFRMRKELKMRLEREGVTL